MRECEYEVKVVNQVAWSSRRDCVAKFYDGFQRRLLSDFAYGNPRVEAAIEYAVSQASRCTAPKILDIGCGIGWSTAELARLVESGIVQGVDLSSELLALAERLFPRIVFWNADICKGMPNDENIYDVVVMLDVYEHIPYDERHTVHLALGRRLATTGKIVLTCPTPLHQEFLRRENPRGLQPVDEDVTEQDLVRLAEEVGGIVSDYREVDIFRKRDYFHATVELSGSSRALQIPPLVQLTPREERVALVEERLGYLPIRGGWFLPRRGQHSVLVATNRTDVYSETFIRAHAEQLPAHVSVLHGTPLQIINGERPLDRSFRIEQRIMDKVARRLFKKGLIPDQSIRVQNAIAEYLLSEEVDVVLAEYSVNGIQLIEPCESAGIPLVVHFHGYDAYRKSVITEHSESYSRLFGFASAVIGVSVAMCRKLESMGVATEKLHCIPYGVDLDKFAKTDPESNPPNVLAVGRFVEKKAPYLTLLAFAEASKVHPEAKLTMVGDGELLESCRDLARSLGVADRVEFPGSLVHEQVVELMQGARVFVQHSLEPDSGDSEGTPVGILEASATGLPVVSTRHAGIPEAVLDGESGLLGAERDLPTMAANMGRFLSDPLLAKSMGSVGREHVAKHYEARAQIGKLWEVMQAVMTSS